MNKKALFLFGIIIFYFTGCSIKQITVNSTSLFMDDVIEAFFIENDLEFAKEAIPANLKLLDGLILASNYENDDLLLKGTKLYGMYAAGFLEDMVIDKKLDKKNLKRAKEFYRRAKEYGLKILCKNNDFKNALEKPLTEFKIVLLGFNSDYVEELFWTAFAWGSYINLDRTSPSSIADLPRVKAMIDRVVELKSDYFYGIPHLFLIVYYSMPKMFGGDYEKAKKEYLIIKDISKGKFLLANFYMAKYYAVSTQDKKLFKELLKEILNAKDDIIKEKMFTLIAKEKAKILLQKEQDLF